jgi:hypothetical protein
MKRALIVVAVIALVSAGWALAQSKPSSTTALGDAARQGDAVANPEAGAADLKTAPTAPAPMKPVAPAAAPAPVETAPAKPATPAAAPAKAPAAASPQPAAKAASPATAPAASSAPGSPLAASASAQQATADRSAAGSNAGSNKPTSQAEAFRQAQTRARTQQTLATGKPKLEFTDTPLKAVLDYLAEIGHFSIVYDKALEEAGIDLAAIPVSITASGLSYENAIRLLLPKECGYRIEAGYVLVTTLEKSWTPLKTVSYSIQVTMAQIPDFGGQAPRFEIEYLGQGKQPGPGGSAGTGLFGAQPQKEVAPQATPDRIIEFVKQFARHANDRRIAPWDDEGGPATIQYLSGHLVISQTEFGHRAVARLLAMIE